MWTICFLLGHGQTQVYIRRYNDRNYTYIYRVVGDMKWWCITKLLNTNLCMCWITAPYKYKPRSLWLHQDIYNHTLYSYIISWHNYASAYFRRNHYYTLLPSYYFPFFSQILRLLVLIRYRMGPKTLPCDTPATVVLKVVILSLNFTWKSLSIRYEYNIV
jgi:hypothetical protein